MKKSDIVEQVLEAIAVTCIAVVLGVSTAVLVLTVYANYLDILGGRL